METDFPSTFKRWTKWLTSHPVEAGLGAVLFSTIVGFYLFYPVMGAGASGLSALAWLKSSWNQETDYGHGYMVPPLILALLAWGFWKAGPIEREASSARWGLAVFFFGILLWIVAYRVIQWRMAVGSMCFVIWGAIWYLGGIRAAKISMLPVFMLALAVPVPGIIQATNGLQVIATQLGYYGAKACGIDCFQSGTNIQSATSDKWGFDIAGGCSGVRSLMAMVLIAAVYVYVVNLPMWRRFLLFAAALPLAILVNAFRIVTILVIAEFGSPEFAGGIYHDYASFFIFPIGLLGMAATHQLLTLDRRVKKRVVRRMTTSEPPAA
ncbi:MAG: exosortase/archaeosortase family protein [Verrucomicrobiales bacterium]